MHSYKPCSPLVTPIKERERNTRSASSDGRSRTVRRRLGREESPLKGSHSLPTPRIGPRCMHSLKLVEGLCLALACVGRRDRPFYRPGRRGLATWLVRAADRRLAGGLR